MKTTSLFPEMPIDRQAEVVWSPNGVIFVLFFIGKFTHDP